VEEMSIGEFARRSRLSPKALRLYDGLGLLSPARVDELSGYRHYEDAQLQQARLIATLRQVGIPLTTVKELLTLAPAELAEQVTAFWRTAEARHTGRRELVTALVDRIAGRNTVMYEVASSRGDALDRRLGRRLGGTVGRHGIGLSRLVVTGGGAGEKAAAADDENVHQGTVTEGEDRITRCR
jgi:PPM family protein phosphatase